MADPNSNKSTKVQLSLYCTKLKNVAGAFGGISDPYAVVTLLSSDQNAEQPRILGQTEVIKNNLNPMWVKKFDVDYEFGKLTRVNVGIYDEVRKTKNAKPMGSAVFEIGEILGARGNIKAKKLKVGGTIFLRAEKAAEVHAGSFHVTMRGVNLKNVDGLFGKSDPFFELAKRIQTAGGPGWQLVYRSPVIMDDLNPKWGSATVDMNELCDGDKHMAIRVSVFDWSKNGKHESMGFFETSVNGLMQATNPGAGGNLKNVDTTKAFKLTRQGKFFGYLAVAAANITGASAERAAAAPSFSAAPAPVVNATPPENVRMGGASNLPPFSMALDHPSPSPNAADFGESTRMSAPSATAPSYTLPPPLAPSGARPNFVDYLSGGLELQLTVAIDFTGSNGDPRRPGTLHYIHPDGQLNDYEKALTAVGDVIARYDNDHKFPVLGFGAKYGGIINHCFQVGPTQESLGIAGILQSYRSVFKSGLVMSGPTDFSEVITMTSVIAQSKQEASARIGQQAYSILLILSDGAVTDINQTKRAIQAASDSPLSIVIVGIGNADFSAMQFLDDFHTASESAVGRDIVQFVEFNRHKHSKTSLTQATLDEIPDQLVDYFYHKGIKPLPPVHGSRVNVTEDEYREDDEIDLNLEFKEDGEIDLASGGYFDGTTYGNYDTYAGVAVMPPPSTAPVPPYNPSAPHHYNPSAPPQTYAPQSYAPQTYVLPGGAQSSPQAHEAPLQHPYDPNASFASEYPQQAYQPTYQGQSSYGGVPVVAAVVAPPPPQIFHVQLPPGIVAGQRLQITSPTTGQAMIVTVPPGVPPGGVFPVQGS
jgi:Copine/C2 domain